MVFFDTEPYATLIDENTATTGKSQQDIGSGRGVCCQGLSEALPPLIGSLGSLNPKPKVLTFKTRSLSSCTQDGLPDRKKQVGRFRPASLQLVRARFTGTCNQQLEYISSGQHLVARSSESEVGTNAQLGQSGLRAFITGAFRTLWIA